MARFAIKMGTRYYRGLNNYTHRPTYRSESETWKLPYGLGMIVRYASKDEANLALGRLLEIHWDLFDEIPNLKVVKAPW